MKNSKSYIIVRTEVNDEQIDDHLIKLLENGWKIIANTTCFNEDVEYVLEKQE